MAKTTPNYRIIRIEKQIKKCGFLKLKSYVANVKITMTKFYAKDDDGAYEYLQEYKRAANKAYDYYYDEYKPTYVTDKTGRKHEFDDSFEMYKFKRNEIALHKRLFEEVLWSLWYYLVDCPRRLWYKLRDNVYLLKNKHKYGEHWSLDLHMLDDLKWNLPILIDKPIGIMQLYVDKAICETHKNDKDFDIREWNKTHFSQTHAEEERAIKFQQDDRKELLKHVKLYEYYRDYGETDDKMFDKLWRHTLPIKKGTYDKFDYDKLEVLKTKQWNKIWEWMRLAGETLWD